MRLLLPSLYCVFMCMHVGFLGVLGDEGEGMLYFDFFEYYFNSLIITFVLCEDMVFFAYIFFFTNI